jgi:hypothetical protein
MVCGSPPTGIDACVYRREPRSWMTGLLGGARDLKPSCMLAAKQCSKLTPLAFVGMPFPRFPASIPAICTRSVFWSHLRDPRRHPRWVRVIAKQPRGTRRENRAASVGAMPPLLSVRLPALRAAAGGQNPGGGKSATLAGSAQH